MQQIEQYYHMVCEMQQQAELRNRALQQDARRAHISVISVDTSKLETLKAQYQNAIASLYPQQCRVPQVNKQRVLNYTRSSSAVTSPHSLLSSYPMPLPTLSSPYTHQTSSYYVTTSSYPTCIPTPSLYVPTPNSLSDTTTQSTVVPTTPSTFHEQSQTFQSFAIAESPTEHRVHSHARLHTPTNTASPTIPDNFTTHTNQASFLVSEYNPSLVPVFVPATHDARLPIYTQQSTCIHPPQTSTPLSKLSQYPGVDFKHQHTSSNLLPNASPALFDVTKSQTHQSSSLSHSSFQNKAAAYTSSQLLDSHMPAIKLPSIMHTSLPCHDISTPSHHFNLQTSRKTEHSSHHVPTVTTPTTTVATSLPVSTSDPVTAANSTLDAVATNTTATILSVPSENSQFVTAHTLPLTTSSSIPQTSSMTSHLFPSLPMSTCNITPTISVTVNSQVTSDVCNTSTPSHPEHFQQHSNDASSSTTSIGSSCPTPENNSFPCDTSIHTPNNIDSPTLCSVGNSSHLKHHSQYLPCDVSLPTNTNSISPSPNKGSLQHPHNHYLPTTIASMESVQSQSVLTNNPAQNVLLLSQESSELSLSLTPPLNQSYNEDIHTEQVTTTTSNSHCDDDGVFTGHLELHQLNTLTNNGIVSTNSENLPVESNIIKPHIRDLPEHATVKDEDMYQDRQCSKNDKISLKDAEKAEEKTVIVGEDEHTVENMIKEGMNSTSIDSRNIVGDNQLDSRGYLPLDNSRPTETQNTNKELTKVNNSLSETESISSSSAETEHTTAVQETQLTAEKFSTNQPQSESGTDAYASFLQSVHKTSVTTTAPPLLDSDSEGIEDIIAGQGREWETSAHSPSPPSFSQSLHLDGVVEGCGMESGAKTRGNQPPLTGDTSMMKHSNEKGTLNDDSHTEALQEPAYIPSVLEKEHSAEQSKVLQKRLGFWGSESSLSTNSDIEPPLMTGENDQGDFDFYM